MPYRQKKRLPKEGHPGEPLISSVKPLFAVANWVKAQPEKQSLERDRNPMGCRFRNEQWKVANWRFAIIRRIGGRRLLRFERYGIVSRASSAFLTLTHFFAASSKKMEAMHARSARS